MTHLKIVVRKSKLGNENIARLCLSSGDYLHIGQNESHCEGRGDSVESAIGDLLFHYGRNPELGIDENLIREIKGLSNQEAGERAIFADQYFGIEGVKMITLDLLNKWDD